LADGTVPHWNVHWARPGDRGRLGSDSLQFWFTGEMPLRNLNARRPPPALLMGVS